MDRELVAEARRCADAGWAWVLDQVRRDEHGPWIPPTVPGDGAVTSAPPDRDCVYEGIAGLAFALAELRLARPWTDVESLLAHEVVERLSVADVGDECGLYTGLSGSVTALALLDSAAARSASDRLAALLTADGWLSGQVDEPAVPVNDVLMGDAGTILVCAWLGGDVADGPVHTAADALRARAVPSESGLAWKMYQGDRDRWMPNYSHGTAGIATALAVAGHRLDRSDLVEAARLGAEHLVTLADIDDGGFRLPLQIPPAEGREAFAYGWCHGPAGTINLFGALELAGVDAVAGTSTTEWRARCVRSLESSGLPARLRPGFWDNDGRCCGTAGVLDAVLTHAQATGDAACLAFADRLASALVDRAIATGPDGSQCCWRFHEHRADPPDLDPGVGWMQGAAGIVAALSRYARVREGGLSVSRTGLPDDWWMHVGPPTS